jgi:hypothetical protein
LILIVEQATRQTRTSGKQWDDVAAYRKAHSELVTNYSFSIVDRTLRLFEFDHCLSLHFLKV